jgi:amidase
MRTSDEAGLCYLDATETLELFRTKELSPVELLQAQISRANTFEPVVNAFASTDFDTALKQARASEARYAKDAPAGNLDGLTVAAKEESPIEGRSLELGSLANGGQVSHMTGEVIRRIMGENGIIHARTTTPEFSCAGVCHSKLWGVTRNPWNPDFSSGGSSGGAGASLASGTSSLATGSDIAGSIRIPSSACGLVGFKPPYGRVPQNYPFNFDSFCHAGPMARSVSDCILLQNVMAGPCSSDMTSLKPKLTIPFDLEDVRGKRIGYSYDLGYFNVDPEVIQNMDAVLGILRDAGAVLEEVDIGWTEDCLSAAMNYLGHFFGNSLAKTVDMQPDLATPYAREFVKFSKSTTAEQYIDALRAAGEMYIEIGRLHETYHALITPTLAVPSVPADFDWTISPKINDTLSSHDPMMVSWCLTYPFNMLNRCPVLQMPSGRAQTGVPTGVQIVGRTYDDVEVFRVGRAIEKSLRFYRSPDQIPCIPDSVAKQRDKVVENV